MTRHLYLCRTAPREWGLFQLEGEDSFMPLGDGSSIINLLSTAVDRIEKSPTTSFTFTCRTIEDVADRPDPLDPANVSAALTSLRADKKVPPIVTIMLMTGEAHRDDMTTLISWSGKFYGSGTASLTHVSRVGRRLLQFFEHPRADQNIVGVTPGKKLRQIENGAAGCGEELWWRPGWTANELIPGSFAPLTPAPAPTRSPEVQAVREARGRIAKARWHRDRQIEHTHVWHPKTRSWRPKPGVRPNGNTVIVNPNKR